MATAETAPATESPHRGSSRERLTDDELLRRAARLVASDWCQRGLATDRYGRQVEPWSEDACSWSPLGALVRIWFEHGGGGLRTFEAAYTSLALATGGRLEEWNAAPWRTKWHVLRAFARAQEFLPEAREQMRGRDVDPSD